VGGIVEATAGALAAQASASDAPTATGERLISWLNKDERQKLPELADDDQVIWYSGPSPPSGGVSRPPLAVIAPHWTQFV
jgi:hypothetical protein